MDCERWISVLRRVDKEGIIHGQPIVLNRSQCCHLARVCFSKLQDLRANGTAFEEFRPILKEVECILRKIESYFKACSEMKWFGYLITNLDSQEAYVVHLHDFLCCMATLDAALLHSKGFSFDEMLNQKMGECDVALRSPDLAEHVLVDGADEEKLLLSMQQTHTWSFYFRRRRERNKYRIAKFLTAKRSGRSPVAAQAALPVDFRIDPKYISKLDSRKIGEGSYGTVFERTWLGQRVAVKEFLTKHPTFVNEAAVLASLSSPYIVQLIGWSTDKTTRSCSLVMELMNETLDSYIASRPSLDSSTSLEVAVDIMLQISRGMEYLHKKKVIHRDLKPSNVLVNPCKHKEGHVRIKLTDFGTAKFKPDSAFYSTEKQGTSYYRAPEVLACADLTDEGIEDTHDDLVFKKYTVKADVFSFAILSYEILTEEAPRCFLNASTKELYTRVTNNVRPDLPLSCPPVLSNCIKKCWDSEPDHRPSFAEISKMLRYVKSLLLGLRSFSMRGVPQDVSFQLDEVVESRAE